MAFYVNGKAVQQVTFHSKEVTTLQNHKTVFHDTVKKTAKDLRKEKQLKALFRKLAKMKITVSEARMAELMAGGVDSLDVLKALTKRRNRKR